MYVHLGVAISKMIIFGFMGGLNDLIQVMVLFCGISQHGFCNLFIYMIFNIFAFALVLTIMVDCGSNDKPISSMSPTVSNNTFLWIYTSLLLVFYVGATFFSFKGYREFKAMMEDQMGSNPMSSQNFLGYGAMDNENPNNG